MVSLSKGGRQGFAGLAGNGHLSGSGFDWLSSYLMAAFGRAGSRSNLLSGVGHLTSANIPIVSCFTSLIAKNSERFDPQAHARTQLNRHEMVL
jgi:hypothetical protein